MRERRHGERGVGRASGLYGMQMKLKIRSMVLGGRLEDRGDCQ